MRPETHWGPGLIVLAVGVIAAVIYFLIAQRRAPSAPLPTPVTPPIDDLEQRSARALEQLKELDAERHHYLPEQLAAERARLESAAAEALRALDRARAAVQGRQSRPSAPERPPGFFRKHPQLTGALWGAAIVGFFVSLGWVLSREQGVRQEGGPMTGNASAQGGPKDAAAQDPQMAEALKRLDADPDNLELMNDVIHQLIRRSVFDEAEKLADRATAIDPFHVETRVHKAIAHAISSGDMAGARVELERLARYYPQAWEARLYVGAIALKSGDNVAALDQFERYLAVAPQSEIPPMLPGSVAELRSRAGR